MDSVDPRINPALVPPGSRAIVYAEHQAEYTPLPSVRTPDGLVITRWALSEDERRLILAGEDLFLAVMTFNMPMQPVVLTIGPADWTGLGREVAD